jgi:DNA adenine methylase
MKYKAKNRKKYSVKENAQDYFSKAEPFLKWAGGKSQLLSQFEKYLLDDFNKYIEPFLGGGAVFFHLYNTGRLHNKEVILIDSNKDLINCYQIIRKDVEKLISCLSNGKYKNNEDIYYKIREQEPTNPIEKAARTIYLNKTCYNGLYRVNQQGKFNVPFGYYKNPTICDTENLKAVSIALKKVKLIAGDFEECLKYTRKDDFVYFDPPYQPISKTSSFTSYTSNSFIEKDQVRLSRVLKELRKRQCKAMISNSDNEFIHELYDKFSIEVVKARRAINCIGAKRGHINELVIYNY